MAVFHYSRAIKALSADTLNLTHYNLRQKPGIEFERFIILNKSNSKLN